MAGRRINSGRRRLARSRASTRSAICTPSAGVISPRAITARTLVSTWKKSSSLRNDERSIPRRFSWVDRSERRRHELRGERPQQMRLRVDQIRQRLRRQRPGSKVGHPSLGIGGAPRPPPRVAGAARIARTRQKRIRTKVLRLLDSRREKQVATAKAGRRRFPASAGLWSEGG